MAEYTPGAWAVVDEGTIRVRAEPGNLVALVAGNPHPPEDHARRMADARLIAAAPDMLEELRLVAEAWTLIEAGKVPGRMLTAWETERLAFIQATIRSCVEG